MSEKLWSAVDAYLDDRLVHPDPVFRQILDESNRAGLPPISITATQGKFLQLLARSIGATKILEIGTLGGYSATWMAKALPPKGKVVTLELQARHAEVARANLERARVSELVDIVVGDAKAALRQLAGDGRQFDFVFIDADKGGYPTYFEWSLKLARPGALIVADNVVRDGTVLDGRSGDEDVQGIRRFLDTVAAAPTVSATAIQTVGSKGYDGFAVILVA